MAASSEVELDELVKRSPWEPRHEWESRLKFVEDHMDTFGLEKTINLSNVWANMKFLGCSYPAKTEALVAAYPVPDFNELRARRKRRQSGQESLLDTGGPPDTKKLKDDLESQDNVASEVDALISSVRMKYEKSSKEEQKLRSTQRQEVLFNAPEMKNIAQHMCLCSSCLGQTANAVEKLHRLFQRFSSKHSQECSYDYSWEEFNFKGSNLKKCVLTVNGKAVAEKHGLNKKVTKRMLAEDAVEAIDTYQRANGIPLCPTHCPQPVHLKSSQEGPGSYPEVTKPGLKSYPEVTKPGLMKDPRSVSGIRSSFFAPATQKAMRGGGGGGRYY